MPKSFFVTGTDTDAGKTLVTAGLLHAARQQGLKTLAMKPIAAGCEATPEGLRNSDALLLQAEMTESMAYEQVNPVALPDAIAPHLAAAKAGRRLSLDRLVGFCRGAMMQRADLCFIEGAGGWRVPLNETESLSGLPRELKLPVIVVVGMRLGCLNHAFLTCEAIARDGLQIAGWVANHIDPAMAEAENNFATLKHAIPYPCLGRVPWLADPTPEAVGTHLSLNALGF